MHILLMKAAFRGIFFYNMVCRPYGLLSGGKTMKSVVITGSTKGIGLGLAREFLKRDCRVVISSRSAAAVQQVCTDLEAQYGKGPVTGLSCDITDVAQVQALWDHACKHFQKVDIWINNAGISHARKMLWELDSTELSQVVDTNVTGMMNGCQVALRGMREQGSGAVYNTEGHGSNDMILTGMSVYGTTKRAVRYFTQALVKETEGSSVRVGVISPGMVMTDLLVSDWQEMDSEQREQARTIFNILADTVETVTPWLVDEILNDQASGTWIEWMNDIKAQQRFEDEAYLSRDLLSEFGL
jgi:NAD(P)-dependent dehydrogenase (short-subunit alcohol dehydrogenase family)